MPISEAVLYDRFSRARQEAVELTDRYRDAPSDAPYRDELWAQVVRKTETARSLLECLLEEQRHATDEPDYASSRNANEDLVSAGPRYR